MPSSIVRSIGMYVPPRIVTNEELTQYWDTSDEWIVTRSGIKARRWIDEPASTAELGYYAAQEALQKAGWSSQELDLIIFATLSPDLYFPGSGVLLQYRLGLETTPALDIRMQCSGFIYGLSVADQYIRSGMYKRILVVGAEVQSTWIDYSPEGRTVGVLFGDGAGALLLEAGEEARGILSTHLFSQGAYAMELCIAEPSSRQRDHRIPGSHGTRPYMNGREVFRHAVQRMTEAIQAVLSAQGWSPGEVDLFVLHQANLRIVQAVAENLGLPLEQKFYNNIHKYGNTTAASIPICLYEAQANGRLRPGDKVVLAAFGSGFTWGSVALIW